MPTAFTLISVASDEWVQFELCELNLGLPLIPLVASAGLKILTFWIYL